MTLVYSLAVFVFAAGIIFIYFARTFGIPSKLAEAENVMQDGNPQKAIDILRKILNVDTGHPKARFLLAKAYHEAEQYILAINELKKLLLTSDWKKFFKESEIRYLMADVYRKLNEWAKEIAEYKIIQTLEPNNPVVNKKLGLVFFDQKDFEKAYHSLKKNIVIDPHDMDIIRPLAISAFETNHLDEAKQFFERQLQIDPNTLEAHYFLGRIFCKEEAEQKAIEHFSRAAEDPDLKEKSWFNIGQIYLDKNDYEKAVTSLQKIEIVNQGLNLEAAFYLGLALEKQGLIQEALEVWQELNEVSSNYRNIRDKIDQYLFIAQSGELRWFYSLDDEAVIKVLDFFLKSMGYFKAKNQIIGESLIEYVVFRNKNQLDSPILVHILKTTKELSEMDVNDFQKKMEDQKIKEGVLLTTAPVSAKTIKYIEGINVHVIGGQDFVGKIGEIKQRLSL